MRRESQTHRVAGTGDGLHRLGGRSGLKTNFGGVAERVNARSDDKTISVRQARVSTEPSGANHAGENKYP